MSKKIAIAIDAMGGDNSPDKTIKGIKLFLEKNTKNNDFVLNIFGKDLYGKTWIFSSDNLLQIGKNCNFAISFFTSTVFDNF